MNESTVYLALAGGLIAGAIMGALAALLTQSQKKAKSASSELDFKIEAATLKETIIARERQIGELKESLAALKAEANEHRNKFGDLSGQLREAETRREEEAKAAAEKLALLEEARVKLADAFKALSSESLKANNSQFLALAKSTLETFQETAKGELKQRQQAIDELIKPINESLKKVDEKIGTFEKHRTTSETQLREQIGALMQAQTSLQGQTASLVNALRKPSVRGSWGEVQLRQAVEFAGMVEHCDFSEQESVDSGRLRPDLVVNMPNGRRLVVDAKAPMEAYLQALDTTDEDARTVLLQRHARQIRDKIKDLSTKRYWEQFDPTPEFVVLFLPNEALFSAALEQDAALINYGAESRVILSTPTTFIALLLAVAYGWQQDKIAAHAKEVSALGRDLYERIGVMAGHFADIGKHLDRSVNAYNKAVRSVETRVLPAARKFPELGAGNDKAIAEIDLVAATREPVKAPELMVKDEEEA